MIVVKYIEIGLLTPPVGFNAYVVKNVVGDEIPLETIFRGIGWFLACEVVIMVLILAFPQLSLWLPLLDELYGAASGRSHGGGANSPLQVLEQGH